MIKEKKLFLIIGWNLLRVTLSILVAIFIVLFSTQKISKISESMMENKRTSFILEKRNEVISELRKNFQLIGDKDKKIKEAIIPTDNILDFVAILESLANQNSLQQSLKFGTPALAVNDVSSIDYYLTINGNILTLMNYLKGFEKLPYITGISSINFQALTDKGWENNSSISIQGKLYVRQGNL